MASQLSKCPSVSACLSTKQKMQPQKIKEGKAEEVSPDCVMMWCVFCFFFAGCPQTIGPSVGRSRLCHFSGRYYCHSCHHGDTTIIPSRMVHNWDLTQREVDGASVG